MLLAVPTCKHVQCRIAMKLCATLPLDAGGVGTPTFERKTEIIMIVIIMIILIIVVIIIRIMIVIIVLILNNSNISSNNNKDNMRKSDAGNARTHASHAQTHRRACIS